jgi:hypothetical protein
MNEQQLQDRLAGLVVDQPTMRQNSNDDLRAGRARLRRRRGGLVAGASVLAVAAVVVAAQAPWRDGATVGRTTPAPVASGAADPASVVIERCTRTDNGSLDASTFGAGSRVLTMETSSGGDVNAVILSSDGRTWGSCWLSASSTTEFNGYATAYPMTEGRPKGSVTETNSMSYGRGQFWYVDRFPPDVATVTVRVQGQVLKAKAVDGFVAFMRDVPTLTGDSEGGGFVVTLYDADGKELAGRANAHGDDSLPPAYRTWVPDQPLPDGGAGR